MFLEITTAWKALPAVIADAGHPVWTTVLGVPNTRVDSECLVAVIGPEHSLSALPTTEHNVVLGAVALEAHAARHGFSTAVPLHVVNEIRLGREGRVT